AFSGNTTYADMYRTADSHLYKAKSNGRDQVSFATAALLGTLTDDAATVH
ncbi:MAG: GGDEF domain-containing protein, partial [Mesorhizobium sp.]